MDAGERTSHFLAVLGGHAGKGGGLCERLSVLRQAQQPSSIILTIRSRPSNASLAFSCTFI